jgi:hypothetical protein
MFLAQGFSERSKEGYAKSISIGVHPGFERWNDDARRGEITVVVSNRFVLQAIGRNVEGIEPVRALVKGVDFGRIAGLR